MCLSVHGKICWHLACNMPLKTDDWLCGQHLHEVDFIWARLNGLEMHHDFKMPNIIPNLRGGTVTWISASCLLPAYKYRSRVLPFYILQGLCRKLGWDDCLDFLWYEFHIVQLFRSDYNLLCALPNVVCASDHF